MELPVLEDDPEDGVDDEAPEELSDEVLDELGALSDEELSELLPEAPPLPAEDPADFEPEPRLSVL
ncbi:MAG: hypothetical protein AB7O92_26175 [Acidimicrobiia bacterium]